ncbi:MAG: Uncharacterized protein LiPW16_367 [Microgenomates group bacterium LiPW_16]|nr:MAG: Uncharacterized protein LiPW16_367 [Microgenomates group bacterium LiPW_16]
MGTQKKKQQTQTQDTVLEQLRDLGGGIGKSVKSDLLGGVGTGLLNELFSPKKKDLKAGEEVVISPQELPQKPIPEIKKPEAVIFIAQEANLAQEVEAVRTELKKTVEELKELNTAVVEVEKAVAQTPVKAGKYHLSFFARLRAILRLFRQQVSESRVWLEASFAKKRKRQYWFMFKKHGTTFGLSSERAIATQAG